MVFIGEETSGALELEGGGSAFSLVWLLIVVASLLRLMVWGQANLNFRALGASIIFISFILFFLGLDLYNQSVERKSTFGGTAFGFWIGALLATTIGFLSGQKVVGSIFSSFTIGTAEIFASFEAQLPAFDRWWVTNVGAPYAEETLFLISIPFILFKIIDYASDSIGLLKNIWVKMLLVVIPTAWLFAYFHVGNVGLQSFVIAAIVFRTMLIGLVHGDRLADIIPSFSASFFFAVGYHMFNNIIATGGLWEGVRVMWTAVFGQILLAWLAITLLAAIYYIPIFRRKLTG